MLARRGNTVLGAVGSVYLTKAALFGTAQISVAQYCNAVHCKLVMWWGISGSTAQHGTGQSNPFCSTVLYCRMVCIAVVLRPTHVLG